MGDREGPKHAGIVNFHKLSDDRTQIVVLMDTEPDGLPEKAASAIGLPGRSVRGDLERFKEMIESRGHEWGPWRGEVPRS